MKSQGSVERPWQVSSTLLVMFMASDAVPFLVLVGCCKRVCEGDEEDGNRLEFCDGEVGG